MIPAQVDELVDAFGGSAARFMQASNRHTFTAPLFNVPGRLVVGSHCFVEHLPELLATIEASCSAREIGARMGALGSRPNYVNLSALMFGYLNGREQLGMLAHGHPDAVWGDESVARTTRVVAFWSEVMSQYLHGAALLPEERGWRLPVLGPDAVSWLAAAASRPGGAAGRRLMAVAELFTFALNGEARVGVLHHGPYDLADGSTLIVKELVGLHDNELGWKTIDSMLAQSPSIDALIRVQRVRDVVARVDLFGSLHSDPLATGDRVLGEATFAVIEGALVEIDDQSIARLTELLNNAMLAIYRETITWSPTEQVSYGWRLYAGLVCSFAAIAGLDIREEVRCRFRETADRVTPEIESGREPLHILGRLGSVEQPYSALGSS